MHTNRLTRTLRRLIRRDPAARLVDTTAGSSCGVMPTAMARENSSASMTGLWSSTLMAKIEIVRVAATYTAYTSPNDAFPSVKELSFKASAGVRGTNPYALVAFELEGQADGGAVEGRYLELGAAPHLGLSGLTVAVPVKVGLSLDGYYEGLRGDERFGFFSVGGSVTVPLSNERSRSVKFQLDKGKVEVTSSSPEFGEAKETLPVDYSDGSMQICFNAQYVMEFLAVVETDQVALELKDEVSQAVMKPIGTEGYDYTYVIMPMRV